MNKDEKKALTHFLIIYIASALFLMSIIAVMYYKKEMASMRDMCNIEMKNVSMNIEKQLMHAEMEKITYTFKPPEKLFRVGLFSKEEKIIYSNLSLKESPSKLSHDSSDAYVHYVEKLTHPIFDVEYIVVEADDDGEAKHKVKLLILGVLLLSLVVVGIVGYFLSRILLHPIQARMHKLNSFIKDSSHELNTPVSALMMSVSSLKNSTYEDTRVINHISISAKLIAQIYNSLSFIAFHDIDEVFDESFDVRVVVQESVKFYNEIASIRHNTIEIELESLMVCMDKSSLQKVIHNLLSNAIKYSYPNSPIRVHLKGTILSVTDEGIGIAKEDKQRIFSRFERRSKVAGGFGIGLDIVSSVCKKYNIKVWVKSKPKIGTTFFLQFPQR